MPETNEERVLRRTTTAAAATKGSMPETPPGLETAGGSRQQKFYGRPHNFSDDSLDSEALLDHRNQPMMRPRRESRVGGTFGSSAWSAMGSSLMQQRYQNGSRSRRNLRTKTDSSRGADTEEDADDRTPLMQSSVKQNSPSDGYGLFRTTSRQRRGSTSTASSHKKRKGLLRNVSLPPLEQEYDVNNPPSVPSSPQLGKGGGLDDVMVPGGDFLTRSPDSQRNLAAKSRDALIDIDGSGPGDLIGTSAPPSPRLHAEGIQRRRTIALPTSTDVCLPTAGMSDLGEEDYDQLEHQTTVDSKRRKRRRGFPQLWVLDEWSREEKEARMGETRVKKIAEPVLVEGRLRPSKAGWHREEEEAPFRYTYFNEDFENTIHSQTISELLQPGQSFRDLFTPEPLELSDTDSETEAEDGDERPLEIKEKSELSGMLSPKAQNGEIPSFATRLSTVSNDVKTTSQEGSANTSKQDSKQGSGTGTPAKPQSPLPHIPKVKRYGRRPAFWLDVMCPTSQEMQVLCQTFGIHALTAEDIMMQEAREKVELFRHYYFINYRTFEQDTREEDFMEPLNMYVIVFQGGVITFHWTQIPHPANVRRRIRQLTDYLELSPDWIAYAIIDDITDVYQPLINICESEVDIIDDKILKLFQETEALSRQVENDEKMSVKSEDKGSGVDLLLQIGECRKKVMSLYRLLGTKADVIKGFAKRCTEQWEVAPKSEIGLYLGDIQDHILTMTSNLSHYENLLSRAHSNYLAQINIRMNERQEQTADILGKLTVIGTIVLPMNVICGMWGMNVTVPGQDTGYLWWFWGSTYFFLSLPPRSVQEEGVFADPCCATPTVTAGMMVFAIVCFFWARKVYKVV